MQNLKEIAIEIFNLDNPTPSKSGGAHEVSLQTGKNWDEIPSQLPDLNQSIASFIDHTLLKPDATKRDVKRLCEEANRHKFKSVCINPMFVTTAAYNVDSGVEVCTVIGFPLGANNTRTKVEETKIAIEEGATEIDMVLSIGAIKAKNYKYCLKDIEEVANVCRKKNALLKVIIETCYLTRAEKMIACLLAKKGRADFVKTSTGFGSGGATVEDIELMRKVVGEKVGVKASGGIRDLKTAQQMLTAGANRLGMSAGVYVMNELNNQ